MASDSLDQPESLAADNESTALLDSRNNSPTSKRASNVKEGGSLSGAAFLLLKSFVGTGVLFLPRAFLNGGMVFSSITLLLVAILSYHSCALLVSTRVVQPTSYGEIGKRLFGNWMKFLINFSLVISQIGFASAYIVFTSENLRAFLLAISKSRWKVELDVLIFLQAIIFLPLSWYRKINNIHKFAILADAFIVIGLLYIFYYDIYTISKNGGISDVVPFNPRDFNLFVGTAIYTFEGIGLVIPIQESMKNPEKFRSVFGIVMIVITVLFITAGVLSYAAFGSKTKTIILLNLPQDDWMVNAIQLIYSCAILLSTPLQFFPAIDITSKAFFHKTQTGRHDLRVKWKKNLFRIMMVVMCALIAWLGSSDLDKFVALVGSFACIPLVYIYPAILHYKAVAKSRFMKLCDILFVVFGLCSMVYTTVLTVQSWASE